MKRINLTCHLAVMSMIIALLIALPIGVLSAVKQDTTADYVGRFVAMLGLSLPDFWLATVAITFLAIWFGWMPPIGFAPIWTDPAPEPEPAPDSGRHHRRAPGRGVHAHDPLVAARGPAPGLHPHGPGQGRTASAR